MVTHELFTEMTRVIIAILRIIKHMESNNKQEEVLKITSENEIKEIIENLSSREIMYLKRLNNQVIEKELHGLEDDYFISNLLKIMNEREKYKKLNSILTDMKYEIIEDKELDWLKDSLRAQVFTIKYVKKLLEKELIHLNKYTDADSYLYLPTYENIVMNSNDNIIEGIYYIFDSMEIIFDFRYEVKEKHEMLGNIRLTWTAIEKSCSCYKWLTEDDQTQIKWVTSYLKSKGHYTDDISSVWSNKNYKEILLASIDFIDCDLDVEKYHVYNQSTFKEKFIERMKKSWTQKKHRDAGKARKPYHLQLTKIAKSRLDEIANIENKKPAAVLEALINFKYEHYYLNQNGEEKYDCLLD